MAIASSVGTPTIHVQSTGGLKVYYGLQRSMRGRHSYRRELTRQLGRYFERDVWSRRDQLERAAEIVAWRARQNLGVPAWWRRDGVQDRIILTTQEERRSVRQWACERWGLRPDKPVVAVFNHAVSDALDGNHEAFGSLYEWFSETAAFASNHPETTWLFLDHPRQDYYDTTGSFQALSERYGQHPHMRFMPSSDLTKNELWALTDLAVTTRGSVSNEFPAFGIPALQAGWSEWSHCGFTMRADTRRQYWRSLKKSLRALERGDALISPEQIRRARLWLWFYRSGADVTSPLIPHWHVDNPQRLRTELLFAFTQPESDADPLFERVAAWWARPTPALMRAASSGNSPRLRGHEVGTYRDPLSTAVDEPHLVLGIGGAITSATQDTRVRLLTGLAPGTVVIGRAVESSASFGLPLADTASAAVLTLTLAVDEITTAWRRERLGEEPTDERFSINIALSSGECCQAEVGPVPEQGRATTSVSIPLNSPAQIGEGLAIVTMSGVSEHGRSAPLVGVELREVRLDEQDAGTADMPAHSEHHERLP